MGIDVGQPHVTRTLVAPYAVQGDSFFRRSKEALREPFPLTSELTPIVRRSGIRCQLAKICGIEALQILELLLFQPQACPLLAVSRLKPVPPA